MVFVFIFKLFNNLKGRGKIRD